MLVIFIVVSFVYFYHPSVGQSGKASLTIIVQNSLKNCKTVYAAENIRFLYSVRRGLVLFSELFARRRILDSVLFCLKRNVDTQNTKPQSGSPCLYSPYILVPYFLNETNMTFSISIFLIRISSNTGTL